MNSISKLLRLFLLLLSVATPALAVDLGSLARRTPYDPYMQPVTQVLTQMRGEAPTMDRVRDLMREGRSFRYAHRTPFVAAAPEVTAADRTGDCKDKSLWLCNELQDSSVRYVIGRMSRTSKINHAWVMWKHEDRWWILDCTMTNRPIAADSVGEGDYAPLFSFSKNGAFRHGVTPRTAMSTASRRSPVAATGARR